MALPRSADPRSAIAAPVPLAGLELARLRRSLLAWYEAAGRTLAIREPGLDPWAVLVAEVMAQQTQVSRVLAPWRAFLERFPDPASLAAVAPAEVIRAWRGLGYNRRALGLQQAAAAIVAGGGRVPADPAALERLPGIGPYTARAVAATAHGRPAAAVDVNVRRVLGRLLAGDRAALGQARAQAAADRLLDRLRPADWNHALMDLGATVCRVASPACATCPLRRWCAAAGGIREADPAAARRAPASAAPARRTTPGAGPVRFESTARWLRGRLVDRLRDTAPGSWVAIRGPLGDHPPEAVGEALRRLAADGLVELDASGRARLPVVRAEAALRP